LVLYAKSQPAESIREHTERLLQGLRLIRDSYGKKIGEDEEFWRMLEFAAFVHDFGKANLLFQNKIRRRMGEPPLPCSLAPTEEIPHNYLSVALFPHNRLGLDQEQWRLLVHAVGYHHERENKPESKAIKQFLEQAIPPDMLQELYEHMGWEHAPEKPSQRLLRILEDREGLASLLFHDSRLFRRYVLLKGLLHRLDHAASAHLDPETGADEHPGQKARTFLAKYGLRPAQQFAMEHAADHVVMVASTGTGKTEAALLWAEDDKLFLTLPLRVSLNAMFARLKDKQNIGLDSLGLLHSGSYDFLCALDELDAEVSYQTSRQLAQKVTLTTIDQILKFPFLYRGFEKELATLSYAKVVIDEIQAYDPQIAAMLIKALEMIAQSGGKFMVMTATLPDLYLQELKYRLANQDQELVVAEFPNDDLLRHRVALRETSVLNAAREIAEHGRNRKVLVICNKVDRAIEVYEALKAQLAESPEGEAAVPVHLLHARFIQKDRMALEQQITAFARSHWHETESPAVPGIWVTTQVVEASVDVDFDMLYTEACTLDSLFQRMGRCYRVRPYTFAEANIHIFTSDVSGLGRIYDRKLTEDSVNFLKPHQGELLTESLKMQLVRRLYSRDHLKGTQFLEKFEEALGLFDSARMFQYSSKESQRMLRKVTKIEVIPPPYWNQAVQFAEQFAKEQDREKRRAIRQQIGLLAVSLRKESLDYHKVPYTPMQVPGLEYLHYVDEADVEYDSDRGLRYKKEGRTAFY